MFIVTSVRTKYQYAKLPMSPHAEETIRQKWNIMREVDMMYEDDRD